MIKAYADGKGTPPPTIEDYIAAGLASNITSEQVADLNEIVHGSPVEDVDTKDELQAFVENGSILFKKIIYGTVKTDTNKTWLDRNLGAETVCADENQTLGKSDKKCFGDYYQWGRGADGHEKFDSNISIILVSDLSKPGNMFIVLDKNNDWTDKDVKGTTRSSDWNNTKGTSVCPKGFRVPTYTELKTEVTKMKSKLEEKKEDPLYDGPKAIFWKDIATSDFKFAASGERMHDENSTMMGKFEDSNETNATKAGNDSWIHLWTVEPLQKYGKTKAKYLKVTQGLAIIEANSPLADARPIRCIKDK
ncbi:MAG: hypothetical protein L3J43_00485 [Sulfurovum sp.]|nr:hypothetical protein [Sulfurovum sp.]